MLPSKHFGRPKAEHCAGVVDAFYPIILTLLIIELPGNVYDSLNKPEARFVLRTGDGPQIMHVVFSYLLVFLIIYEIFVSIAPLHDVHYPQEKLTSSMVSAWQLFPYFHPLSSSLTK